MNTTINNYDIEVIRKKIKHTYIRVKKDLKVKAKRGRPPKNKTEKPKRGRPPKKK